MLEADVVMVAHEMMVTEMKDKVKKEYHRSVRKVFETKLNIWNVFNTWRVSVANE